MPDAIVTERLTKHYGNQRVVDSLDLRVPQGSVYGLLGRNGAGKSTVIKMLLGMVQPDSGRAQLLGEDAAALSNATRSRVAYGRGAGPGGLAVRAHGLRPTGHAAVE